MAASVLKGSDVVEAMNVQIAEGAEFLKEKGIVPLLAILRVGERGDDVSYERGAIKRAEKVGVATKNVIFPENVAQEDLLAAIEDLNNDQAVHGVLIFRPLPTHIDEDAVCNALDPKKDVDGITDLSLAGVFSGNNTGYAPCTAQACMEIIDHFGYQLKGKNVVVIGRSLVVGKPLAMMLLGRHATVTIAHSRTENLAQIAAAADVVIACVGRAQMVDESYLSQGQIVIDVGINVTSEGALVGDVDFESAQAVVEAITPVPGGVGTVTTSTLMKHVVEAASQN